MKKEIILTADGSYTVCIPEMKVTYHSLHGAISESMHVFIEAGLKHIVSAISSQPIYIFEMVFGTGLNAFLTAIAATELKRKIHYTAIETLPLTFDEVARLKYSEEIGFEALFQQIHASNWEETVEVNECYTLQKIHQSIFNYSTTQVFNLI